MCVRIDCFRFWVAGQFERNCVGSPSGDTVKGRRGVPAAAGCCWAFVHVELDWPILGGKRRVLTGNEEHNTTFRDGCIEEKVHVQKGQIESANLEQINKSSQPSAEQSERNTARANGGKQWGRVNYSLKSK